MKSKTTLENLFASLTNNSTATNKALGLQLMNDTIRRICAGNDWPWLQKTKTMSTVASQQFYDLPNDYDRLLGVTVTVGSTRYKPSECRSREQWDMLNRNTSVSSNTPAFFFIFDNQIGFFPMPSSSTSNAITLEYRRRIPDLSVDDYTTGNALVTQGATTVTGSGTSWSSAMIGRYIKLTPTSTAGGSGDGLWYEITAVGGATSLTIGKPYLGATVSVNTAHTIAEIPVIPESYQDIPVFWACYVYFSSVQPERQQGPLYKSMFDENLARLYRDYSAKTASMVVEAGGDTFVPMNPNLAPENIGT